MCEQVLIPELTPKFIYDNCATLEGKGIDFAIKRAKLHLQQAHKTYGLGKDFFGLRIDIRKYFDSIDHKALKEIAKKVIRDEKIYELVTYLIDTFSFKLTKDITPMPNKTYYQVKNGKYIRTNPKVFKANQKYYEYSEVSLGLGSQTSQLFALLTLNEVDHFIKEKLHIKYYGRYMDDLYLLHNDSKYLTYCLKCIEEKLKEIGLSLNKDKTTIVRIHPFSTGEKRKNPFKYLKWNFYLTASNKLIMIPFKAKISHQRRKLKKMAALWKDGRITDEDIQTSYRGWREHISKGNTFYIVQEMDNYFSHLFKGVEIK